MFGKRLRLLRMKNKFTQQNMADKLNIALVTYQKYEQSDRTPSLGTLIKIADIFNVPVDFLLGRDKYLETLGVSADEFL